MKQTCCLTSPYTLFFKCRSANIEIYSNFSPYFFSSPLRSQFWWREPLWTPRLMTTTAVSTRSSTPQPASTQLPLLPRYTASRMSHSPCPAMPSGSGSPSSRPLETLWWLALSMPSLSDKHMLTKTNTRTHLDFSGSLEPWVRPRFVDRHSFYMSLSLSLSPSHLAFGSVWAPTGVKVVILDNDT